MDQPHMILDYAGPRKRSRFRLASKSLLESRVTADGGVVVREWLAGQQQALAAIVATGLMLGASVAVLASDWRRTPLGVLAVPGGLIAVALALIPVVVQQSWRQTVLRAWDGTLRLSMGGPLARRTFAWRFDEVDAVRVIVTQSQAGASVLAEIEILAARTPPIRLFTDHPEKELTRIHGEIDAAMRGIDPAAAAESAARRHEEEQERTRDLLRGAVERTRGRGHRTFPGDAGRE